MPRRDGTPSGGRRCLARPGRGAREPDRTGLTAVHTGLASAPERAATADRRGTIMTRGNFKRWHKWVVAAVLAATGGLSGCTKPLYMTPETQTLATSVGLPADLTTNPNLTATPDVSDHKPPATVLDANREPRYMTLQEAMAIALERGTRGNASSFLFQNFN